MAKNEGKKFEEDLFKSFPSDVFVYRLRDSSGAWGGDNEKTRFTPSNICDFLAINPSGKALLLELKSTKGKSIPFNNFKNNQIKGLYNASYYEGVNAYFVINFRDTKETFAIDAKDIKKFIETSDRKSIPISWCKENGIEIKGKLKRIRYTYQVGPILN